MASTRIPGPLVIPEDDPLEGQESWAPSRGPHHFHLPGPSRLHREPSYALSEIRVRATHPLDYDALVADLKRWEGFVPHMYVDSVGVVTVGIGNALRTAEAAENLPFLNVSTAKPATDTEIADAYNNVSRLPKAMRPPSKYKLQPSLEISEEFARGLALRRLVSEFVPAARRLFFEFDYFPGPAQRLIVDMTYNGGPGFFAKRNMVTPIEERRWLDAVPCLPTRGDQHRRAWRERMLREAAAEDSRAS